MALDMESKLALQAARGIAALQLVQKIKSAASEAQVACDLARITFNRETESINEAFTANVIRLMAEHERQNRDLMQPDDYPDDYEDD